VDYLLCPSDRNDSSLAVDMPRFHICRSEKRSDGQESSGTKRQTYFGIGVTQLDCDVSDKFVLKSDGHNPRDCFNHRRLSVSDMSDSSCDQNLDGFNKCGVAAHLSLS